MIREYWVVSGIKSIEMHGSGKFSEKKLSVVLLQWPIETLFSTQMVGAQTSIYQVLYTLPVSQRFDAKYFL